MSFHHALDTILSVEGEYSDDPGDTGGKTRYGITEAVARSYGYFDKMEDLPLPTAQMIYRAEYWDKARCELYPQPLDMYVFDCAVNQGVGTCIKLPQKSLGVAQDGVIGPVTRRRLQVADVPELCALYMANRIMRYMGTRHADKYLLGWVKRVIVVASRG